MATVNLNLAKTLASLAYKDNIIHEVFQVTAVNTSAKPPSITVQDGYGASLSNVLWPANSYTPAVNDLVFGIHSGDVVLIIGKVPTG